MVEYAEFDDYMASQIRNPITEEDTEMIAEADVNCDLQVSDKGMTLFWNFGPRFNSITLVLPLRAVFDDSKEHAVFPKDRRKQTRRNISDTLGYRLMCHVFVLTTF